MIQNIYISSHVGTSEVPIRSIGSFGKDLLIKAVAKEGHF